jgi:chromosomal replication initiation ATPase DnaA
MKTDQKIETIEDICAKHFGVPVDYIKSRGREDKRFVIRSVMWRMLIDSLHLEQCVIADRYGFSEANISHALRSIGDRIETERALHAKVEVLSSIIKSRKWNGD